MAARLGSTLRPGSFQPDPEYAKSFLKSVG
jgi:hypothetical protein